MVQLIKFEFEKLWGKRIVLIGLIAMVLFNVLMYSGWGAPSAVVRTADDSYLEGMSAVEYDKQIAARYQGALTDEKVQQILADFPMTGENESKYVLENSTLSSLNEFRENDGSWNGATIAGIYPTGALPLQLGYSYGWTNLLYSLSQIFLVLGFLIIIAVAPSFSEEYTRGTDALILTSRFGKKQCARAKIIAAFLFTLLITAFFAGVNLLLFFTTYGAVGWEASVQLNHMGLFMDTPYVLTFGQAFLYSLVLWFSGMLVLTAFSLLFSSVSKTSFVSLIISLFCYVTPMFINTENPLLVRILSVNPIRHMQTFSLLPLEQLSLFGRQINYTWAIVAFMLVLAVLVWHFGKRFFAKHQVVS